MSNYRLDMLGKTRGGLYLTKNNVFAILDCMTYSGTITSKGQLTIPAELFKLGKFTKGEKVNLEFEGDHLKVVSGLAHVRKLAGSVKVPEHLRGRDLDEIIEEAKREHFLKKYGKS